MFARALIVLLVVANLGVALWWALQPAARVPAAPAADPGVPLLQLIAAGTPAAAPAPVAAQRAAACHAFGPFANAAAAQQARAALQPRATHLRLRAAVPAEVRAWRVWLPPQADRAAAEALAARIRAAGFTDYFILSDGGVPGGSERNAIALGRFGNEAGARARAAALQARGFPAEAEPMLAPAAARWLDVRGAPGFDPQEARDASGAAQALPIVCWGWADTAR